MTELPAESLRGPEGSETSPPDGAAGGVPPRQPASARGRRSPSPREAAPAGKPAPRRRAARPKGSRARTGPSADGGNTTDQLHEIDQYLLAAKLQSREAEVEAEQAGQIAQEAKAQAELARQELHEAERELVAVRQQAEEARAQLATCEDLVDEARAQAAAAQEELEQARVELATIRSEAEEARRQLDRLRAEVAQGDEFLRAARRQSHDVREGFVAAEQFLDAARSEAEKVRREASALHEELDEAGRLVQAARELAREASRVEAQRGIALRQPEEPNERARAAREMSPAAPAVPGEGRQDDEERQDDPALGYFSPPEGSLQDRLLRSLNEALGVEQRLVDVLQDMADEVPDPIIRGLLLDERRLAHEHQQGLERRIRDLGQEPSGKPGPVRKLLSELGNALRRPRDDFDRALKDLMTAIAVKHFKVAMYEALSALAAAAEDEDTVTLAQGHLTAEREGSARVERLIAPTAALAARASEEAAAEAQS